MDLLISGSTGFLGKNLTRYLLQTSKFSIMEISREQLKKPWNILEKEFNPEFSSIIHLAGKAHDLKKVGSPDDYYVVNYELTKKIFDAFINSNAKKFIFISSVKAVADELIYPLTEDFISNPKTHYGKSKLIAEQYIQNQPLPEGKTYYILRPCMVHGPGNKGNLNLLYKLISKGVPYPLAAFENKRSFLSVENLCFVIRELLERNDIPSGVYNVADDETLSTNELIQLIARTSDRKPILWMISPGLIKFLAKLGDILKLPLTTERLNKLTENYIVDNTKIRQVLGKEFPVQARDGIMKTIKSFKG